MGMGHARGRERGARRSRRPIYYFDIVHDYPEVGGVAEFSQRPAIEAAIRATPDLGT
jgi:hypothetical protein